jgi:hypothetical protein
MSSYPSCQVKQQHKAVRPVSSLTRLRNARRKTRNKEDAGPQRYNFHTQIIAVSQATPGVPALYSGPNSLNAAGERQAGCYVAMPAMSHIPTGMERIRPMLAGVTSMKTPVRPMQQATSPAVTPAPASLEKGEPSTSVSCGQKKFPARREPTVPPKHDPARR